MDPLTIGSLALVLVVVGGLEVDSAGNVNVAARKDPLGYVGPGGFVDLT